MLMKRNRINTDIVAKDRLFPSIKELVSMIITFSLTVFAWIFFRSESVNDGFAYLFNIIDSSVFTLPDLITPKLEMIYTLFCILILLLFEWKNREKTYALDIDHLSKFNRWAIYLTIILMIITFGTFNQNAFIYFQF